MTIGFIYCLTNHYMPGICKIGRTDRSPSQRCKELSDATAVPLPFDIQFYFEVDNAMAVERAIHNAFALFRVNESREFFSCKPVDAYEWLESNFEAYTEYLDGDLIFALQDLRQAAREVKA